MFWKEKMYPKYFSLGDYCTRKTLNICWLSDKYTLAFSGWHKPQIWHSPFFPLFFFWLPIISRAHAIFQILGMQRGSWSWSQEPTSTGAWKNVVRKTLWGSCIHREGWEPKGRTPSSYINLEKVYTKPESSSRSDQESIY